MIDDDDDELLFDMADELPADFVPTNCLVVGPPPPKPEMLNELEARYRREGLPPVMFVEEDDAGNPVFGNAATFAAAMKLPAGILPTIDRASDWVARERAAGRWASWTW